MFTLWQELIEVARYAPSPHNVQPWRLRIVSETSAELLYDPARLIPDEDKEGSFTLAGFAIFLEYLGIAAQEKGHLLSYVYNGRRLDRNAAQPTPLFQLSLTPTDLPPRFPPRLITERRTSRLPYRDQAVSSDLQETSSAIAREFQHNFTFTQEPELVRWLLRLNCDTLFYDMDDDLTRKEVASWIRFTRHEALLRKDGLAAFCLNMPGAILRLFFLNHHLFNLPLVKPIVKRYYLWTMRGTRSAGWIRGSFETPEDWLQAGHMLGRIWLCMTAHGVYLHPFGSIITNPIAHRRLREKFAVDEAEAPLWLIMRLGHSDLPPRSIRLEARDILMD